MTSHLSPFGRPKGFSRKQGTTTQRRRRQPLIRALVITAAVSAALIAAALWVGTRGAVVKENLSATNNLLSQLQASVSAGRTPVEARSLVQLQEYSTSAREAASDPLWKAASALPWVGANFSAVTETSVSTDDVVRGAVIPLLKSPELFDLPAFVQKNGEVDVQGLQKAAPKLVAASNVVSLSYGRMASIDRSALVPEVSGPLLSATEKLGTLNASLKIAADAARLSPTMLGVSSPRRYLLLIQNNAESRATGGIPGALAVATLSKGKMTLGEQTSAAALGAMSPVIPVSNEQQEIYSGRIGKFMQDVNLTPDFPTTASTAISMWERKKGSHLDGVISIDPITLSYILRATGPVQLADAHSSGIENAALPTTLSATNVVQTLLSDAYSELTEPGMQDRYFAAVAKDVFGAISSQKGDPKKLLDELTRSVEEGRTMVWSAMPEEEALIAQYRLSGSIAGPSISPAQFGVYFNDGTGAKMDYHVKRTVQLLEECPADGYAKVKVRVTSTNTAPEDAATSLPAYVTGGGVFGVPEGSVQTNVVAYGPVQSNVETAFVAGKKTGFASQRHNGRPVGTVTVRLAPGQSTTVEFTFDKIAQHTEPQLSVTPTVQALKDVVLDTIPAKCVPAP